MKYLGASERCEYRSIFEIRFYWNKLKVVPRSTIDVFSLENIKTV